MSKPDLALLIGKPVKKPMDDKMSDDHDMSDEPSMDDGSEQKDMEHSAVSDFMAALQSKDVEGAAMALKDFISMCGHSEPDGDE